MVQNSSGSETLDPVTLVVARRPRPGREADLEAWLAKAVAVSGTFPGHQGAFVIRPHPGQAEFVFVGRYADRESLQGWWNSPECARLLAEGDLLTETMDIQTLTGLEGWFMAPDRRSALRPAPWKMTVVTWAVIWPLVLAIGALSEPLLHPLPLAGKTLVTTGVLCVLMTWVVMPQVTRLLRPWLFGREVGLQPVSLLDRRP